MRVLLDWTGQIVMHDDDIRAIRALPYLEVVKSEPVTQWVK